MEQQASQVSSPLSLVLLPGLDGSGRLFEWFVKALPPTLKPQIICFPKHEDDYGVLETDVLRLLPQGQPFVILAESFSGPLALRVAAIGHPHLIAVILVASFASRPVAWMPRFARHIMRPLLFRLPGQVLLMRWFLFGDSAPVALIEGTIDCLNSVDPAVLAGRTKAALTVDATEAFLRCPVPILYLGGIQDRLITPQTSERLKSLRPDLECVMLDAPHFLLQRAPAAAVKAVTDFLWRLKPAGRHRD
ncbi:MULTISPECIES: alpha/beta fold hydrolase [unclassified Bradyrhizobium]|uniref:alpha/beta fold hydrolase n=1 Tax=unclassified Bradyrhizobium TaxID=2631580 RepID=UPI001BA76727|nr:MULTISPECIES: alpha/beta fold hydrolase [unclassified Bradyrhizobium]MBR1223545.1 alpha/beta fold hydrolase [Bradyrhizobium sp. AUGA SZCCT0176]MBR1296150.1 alpha/beta fold hydrolase [Bradyrhizobium sp. AUGA SZCCT0042]